MEDLFLIAGGKDNKALYGVNLNLSIMRTLDLILIYFLTFFNIKYVYEFFIIDLIIIVDKYNLYVVIGTI
ncbi:hypothetical protein EAJ17_02745 [Akkermansia sp. aa_0143]|nr:hypothetical protein EAJ17_02745 [Akkermansia sp. aa_0143]